MSGQLVNPLRNVLLGVGLMVLACPARAELIVYQEGASDPIIGSTYTGTEDTTLLESSIWTNRGAQTQVAVGYDSVYKARRSLLRFDVTSLDGQYSAITGAKLRLHVITASVDTANTLNLYRFTTENGIWVEGTKTGQTATTGESCWALRNYGSGGTPGDGNNYWDGTEASDYVGGIDGQIASLSFGPADPSGWIELEFTDVSFIEDWVAGNNPGLVLRVLDDSSDNSKITFYSAEYTDDLGLRPQLVLDVTLIPEPSTGLLGLCGLLVLVVYGSRSRWMKLRRSSVWM